MEISPDPLLSPLKAARAASDSKAWSNIHVFLGPIFRPQEIPPFEHNQATLEALQKLVAHCDNQTERNCLLAATKEQALKELTALSTDPTISLLDQVEELLTPEGLETLENLASLSASGYFRDSNQSLRLMVSGIRYADYRNHSSLQSYIYRPQHNGTINCESYAL